MKDIYFDKNKKDTDIPSVNLADITDNEQNDNFAPYTVGKNKTEKIKAEKNIKKKRKKKSFFRKIISFALVFVIIVYGLTAFAAAISGYQNSSLQSNSFISSSQLRSDLFIKNILLIGVDGTSSDDSLRSDSMILVSLDNKHGKIKLSSFMRDSWVQIPGYKYSKLNAACSRGGPQLVVDTIEYNFGIDIDEYVLVDFTMFTEIIDALGGVDVEVTNAEANFITRTTRHTLESGESVHLDGAKALVYCRIRKLDSDHMRTFRQRKEIKALIGKISIEQIPSLIKAAGAVFPKIETSMNPFELSAILYRGLFSAAFFDVESTRIPLDEYSWGAMKGSQSVVELNIEANSAYLLNYIYNGSAEPVDN